MNEKIAKLTRRLAKTNPYSVDDIDGETRYGQSKLAPRTIVLSPGFRLTNKFIKKFYKQGKFTSDDMRSEVARHEMEKLNAH